MTMTELISGYHCPFTGCLYSSGSVRYFASKRFLTQHIQKVHAEKKFTCEKCQKGFGSDWWRKYHEKSCGMDWVCSCGLKYLSKESLLTHARRTQHSLPNNLKLVPKKNVTKVKKKPDTQLNQSYPIIYMVQPFLPQISLIVTKKSPRGNNIQPILPKQEKTISIITPVLLNNEPKRQISSSQTVNSCQPTNLLPLSNSRPTKHNSKEVKIFSMKPKTVAETQTSEDFSFQKSCNKSRNSVKNLESRGSQCSGRIAKQRVRIESTCTQTNESAVVKMKKRNGGSRSRKKSVAVLTESAQPMQSLWSGLSEYLIPNNGDVNTSNSSPLNKNSSSTQTTTTRLSDKLMRDSQTLTESYLFNNWTFEKEPTLITDETILTDVSLDIKGKMFSQPNVDIAGNSATISPFEDDPNYSSSKLFSNLYDSMESNNDTGENKFTEDGQNSLIPYLSCTDQTVSTDMTTENLILDTMFPVLNTVSEGPQLLHSHTQTNPFSTLDYDNILLNMETQTSDDNFIIPDLEFLDTETQTPWEDIQSIEENINTVEKYLSIQIQTDFDSLNFAGAEHCFIDHEKSSAVIHTETQTQEVMAHVTNAEAQTLKEVDGLFF